MEVQPQLVLLQKTLFNIEGLGRRLYPELDLWETAKPYLERWMREHMGPQAFLHALRREFPKWWAMLPELPALAHEYLRRTSQGETAQESRAKELDLLRRQMRDNHRRLYFAVAGSGLLIAGAVILQMDVQIYGEGVWGHVLGWLLAVGGVFTLLRGWSGRNP
jgi:ubiquinone biosynthesis protein